MGTKNSKLTVAYWLVWLTGYGSFFLGGLFLLIAIHFSFAPHHYDSLELSSTMFSVQVVDGNLQTTNLSQASLWRIWLVFLQGLAIFSIIGVMCIYGRRIIQSVRKGKVFNVNNPKWFQRIGLGFLILAALTFADVTLSGEVYKLEMNLKGGYILAALFAYILAEIFQEGNRLDEESKLTV
ncbi:MAG: DUF2975 domain-containing protein [Cryomorphaceae bacterium]|nr:DUF2975 domain-containing protein [Cryomorphaceae bacterium]